MRDEDATGKLRQLYDTYSNPDGSLDNILTIHSCNPPALEVSTLQPNKPNKRVRVDSLFVFAFAFFSFFSHAAKVDALIMTHADTLAARSRASSSLAAVANRLNCATLLGLDTIAI